MSLSIKGTKLKPPTTFEEQVEILCKRGLHVEDKAFAIDVISKVNYYRFTAYLLPFKKYSENCYKEGATFNNIYRTYEFDQRLRNVILSAIEPIEILLRTKLAYYHSHEYGAEGYMSPDNFDRADLHNTFNLQLQEKIRNNASALFVSHHINRYEGHFPIWVAVELFSIGMLSKFYANMKLEDRKSVAKIFNTGPDHLKSWLICITYLRNLCAHYMRLYFNKIVKIPKLPRNGLYFTCSRRVYDIIYVMKYLYLNDEKWKNSFVSSLEALINQYNEYIKLKYIGFPDNWLDLLEKRP